MIIKYVKKKEIEKSGYSFIQIVGEKQDGSRYTKDFFANDQKLPDQLDEFAPGEFLLLTYKNDKFKNLDNIASADGFPESSGGGKSYGGGDDAGSSTMKNRSIDNNRASAMYLAKDVVDRCSKKTLSIDDFVEQTINTAGIFLTFLLEGRNTVEEEKVQAGLAVPDIDEED